MNDRVYILDIPIDTLSFNDLKHTIKTHIKNKKGLFISTVNASFIYKALSNNDFKQILNSTNINTADGVSVQLASEYLLWTNKSNVFSFLLNFILGIKLGFLFLTGKLNFTCILNRITGVELTEFLLKLANNNKLNTCILNRSDGLTSNNEIIKYIDANFPNINFRIESVNIKESINKDLSAYSIILCTLGEYYQEKLLYKYINNTDAILVGIGSTFDVLTQKIVKVDAKYKQKGLEWLLRLLKRPSRFPKIYRSVVLFPLKVYLSTLLQKDKNLCS